MKVNLYIDGIKVKTVYRKTSAKILEEVYKVKVFNHKEIFNKYFIETNLKPMQVIRSEEEEIDLNCIVWGGVNID